MHDTNRPQAIDRCAYLGRVSTPRQQLRQQWEQVERWLTAEGLSVPEPMRFEDKIRRHEAAALVEEWDRRKGNPGRKRYRFDALMALVEARAVDWIIIAAFDRWGIKDKADIFGFCKLLRRYDVQLYSVQDQLNITGTDDANFLQVAIKAQVSTGYVATMADNNIRKMVSMAQGGWAATGNAPFGLDLVCYNLSDLSRPLFRVVRMRWKNPALYKVITYTADSRVDRDERGIITSSRLKIAGESINENMPPRDKKATGYRYEPTQEKPRLDALRLLFEMADSGMTFADISNKLWEQKHGHYDKPFGYHGVETILQNSAYIGLPAWGKVGVGEYRHAMHKTSTPIKRRSTDTLTVKKDEEHFIYPLQPLFVPLVDGELFRRVRERIKARPHVNESFGKRRTRDKATHPLNGKVVCPDCGAPMVLGSMMPKGGEVVRSFQCGTYRKTNRTKCHPNTVRWELVDGATQELLRVVGDRIDGLQKGTLPEVDRQGWLARTELGRIFRQMGEVVEPADVAKNLPRRGKLADLFTAYIDAYDAQHATQTSAAREELAAIEEELEGAATELVKHRARPTIYKALLARVDELEGRKRELESSTVPLTGRARAILAQLAAIKDTIASADKVRLAGLLDSFLLRVEPIFNVKEVGAAKKRATEVVGFRFTPRESAAKVLPSVMELWDARTGTGSSPPRGRTAPGTSSPAAPARWSRCPSPAAAAAPPATAG